MTDGVLNTPMWNEKGTKCSYGWPKEGKVNNFQAVQWLSEFCKSCKYDIVVTSTWRSSANYAECLKNGGLREGIEILGKTDDLNYEHPWPELTRGYEIKKYLEEHPEIKYYIIIDDENHYIDVDNVLTTLRIRMNDSFGFTCKNLKFPDVPEMNYTEEMYIRQIIGICYRLESMEPMFNYGHKNRWEEIESITLTQCALNKFQNIPR